MGLERILVPCVYIACLWSVVCSLIIKDLTHKLVPQDMPHYPYMKPFSVENTPTGGDWTDRSFCMGEHIGTHIDAPSHFYRAGQKLHQLSLQQLIGPGVVVNIKERALIEHRSNVTKEDLEAWEQEHGKIPEHSIVLMASGWSDRWGLAKSYLGSDETDVSKYKFPGFNLEAAEFLVSRNVSGVGVDSASVDAGGTSGAPVHKLLAKRGVYCIENLDKVDDLPPKGTTIYAIPIYIKDGTGAPARVFAIINEDEDDDDDNNDNDDDDHSNNDNNFAFKGVSSVVLVVTSVLFSVLPALLC